MINVKLNIVITQYEIQVASESQQHRGNFNKSHGDLPGDANGCDVAATSWRRRRQGNNSQGNNRQDNNHHDDFQATSLRPPGDQDGCTWRCRCDVASNDSTETKGSDESIIESFKKNYFQDGIK